MGLIVRRIVSSKGEVILNFARPHAFYGLFYLLYYVVPYLLLFYSRRLAPWNQLLIAFLVLLGCLAWQTGMGTDRPRLEAKPPAASQRRALALFWLCVVGIGLIIYLYFWRVEHGIFYSHARYYEQALTVGASLRDVFVSQFQLPIIIFLGLLARRYREWVGIAARKLMWSYGLLLTATLVLSSQTRPAITAMLFVLASKNLYNPKPIKARHFLMAGIASLVIVVVVQGSRVVARDDFAAAENQFSYALQHSAANTVIGATHFGSDIVDRTITRAGGGVDFLSTVIDAIRRKGGYLLGRDLAQSFWALVPRAVWHNKPAVEAPQIVVEKMLNLPLVDASFGPLTQFYSWFGWVGVAAGYLLFGLGIGRLTRWAISSANYGPWIYLAFILSDVVQIEQELFLGMLVTLRNASFVYLLYIACASIIPSSRNAIKVRNHHSLEVPSAT
jgi:hypothetical protein